MSGITYNNLASILDFIYNGEVNVAQKDLNSFLAIAEELQIKGLIKDRNTNSIKNPLHSFSSNNYKTQTGPRFSDRDEPPLKKVRKYKPDQMAITPVSKSNAKAIKVQNMVKYINDETEITEALVQDIQVAGCIQVNNSLTLKLFVYAISKSSTLPFFLKHQVNVPNTT